MIETKKRYTFKYCERLHLKKDFDKVIKFGRRQTHPAIFVYTYKRKSEPKYCRLGIVTSRKIGKAVERNTTKRRLREIFRTNKHNLISGLDIVFIPKKKCVTMKFSQIKDIIFSAWKTAKALK
ncbi:ribonuclease P protein component [Elusimicrobiota bacterium]